MVNKATPAHRQPTVPPGTPTPSHSKFNGRQPLGWVKSLEPKAPPPLRRVVGISPPRRAPKIFYAPRRFTIDQKES